MLRLLPMLLVLVLSSASFAGFQSPKAPNPKLSPGKLCSPEDSDYWRTFGEGEQAVHICSRNVSMSQKYQTLSKYGIDKKKRSQYKIDHVIPLNIGGSNDSSNLFPIDKSLMGIYERAEWPIYQAFRHDMVTTKEAQSFVKNWKYNSWDPSWRVDYEENLSELEEMFPNTYND